MRMELPPARDNIIHCIETTDSPEGDYEVDKIVAHDMQFLCRVSTFLLSLILTCTLSFHL